MTDYLPIDCALHSEYELAILQHRRLHLTWLDSDDATHSEIITPTDLVTRQGKEFMIFTRSGGETGKIRLDRIIRYHNA
jgi:transcriptional antiterminator Rof (Rho-off)